MADTDSHKTYNAHVSRLREKLGEDAALSSAIGGEFIAVGTLEYSLLLSLGLADGQCVIDVGCGSGRLAYKLAAMPNVRYLGVDVVDDLLDYARRMSGRTDWRFERTAGAGIPSEDGQADFVCFFSVFTHLVHEETFRYLEEARRVLQPGGRIVFSFLEFRIPCQWMIFEDSLARAGTGQHLNQFMDRDGIRLWAQKLGLEVELIVDGDQPHIPIAQPVVWENGTVMRELGNFGQSVAVLRVPAGAHQTRSKVGEKKPDLVPPPRLQSEAIDDMVRAREQRIVELDDLARTRERRIFELDAERRNNRSTWAWALVRWEQMLRKTFASAGAQNQGESTREEHPKGSGTTPGKPD